MNDNNSGANNYKDFYELNDTEKKILLEWIREINPIKSFNVYRTSYGLKHIFEDSERGFYITNGQFKGAMLEMGFSVKDKTDINWCFNVSEKSIKQKNNENKQWKEKKAYLRKNR